MKFFGWLGSLFGRSRLDKGQMSNPFIGTTSASGNAINAETALELLAVRAIAKPSHRLFTPYDTSNFVTNCHARR